MESPESPAEATSTDGGAATDLPATGAVPTTPDLTVPQVDASANGGAGAVDALIYEDLVAERGTSPV